MKTKKIIEEIELTDGRILEIELSYLKGGINYFNGRSEKRGFYINVTPVKITKCDGYSTKEFAMFHGIKGLFKEVSRFSQKILNETVPSRPEYQYLINHVLSKEGLTIKKEIKETPQVDALPGMTPLGLRP